MFNFLKHEKFPTILFVISSLLALVVFVTIYSFTFFSNLFSVAQKVNDQIFVDNASTSDEVISGTDPFLTKIKSLKDIIKGPIISDNDPQAGAAQAKVAIVQYSDYACQYCNQQEQTIKKVISKFPGKVRYIRKDYPTGKINSLSFKAAAAARCAGDQGKYWQYHDRLVASTNLQQEDFNRLADELNLSSDFDDCLQNNKYFSQVQNNILEADALDISGVPFVFVNDKEFMGQVSEEELTQAVQSELK